MNEQIKELIRKADSRCSETRGVFDEILAKMVVQECIDTINNTSNGYRDYRNQIEDAMREACIYDIKAKFGMLNEND